jgi:hypothetical protein
MENGSAFLTLMSTRNKCGLPKISNFCQGCDGKKTECQALNNALSAGNNIFSKPEKKEHAPAAISQIMSVAAVFVKKAPRKENPYEECRRGCFPKDGKTSHCRHCEIYTMHAQK